MHSTTESLHAAVLPSANAGRVSGLEYEDKTRPAPLSAAAASIADAELLGIAPRRADTPVPRSSASFPELLSPEGPAVWETPFTHSTVSELLSVMNVLFGASYVTRLQQMDAELTDRRDQSIELFIKQAADLKNIQEKQTQMAPGEVAAATISAVAFLAGLMVFLCPFLAPVAATAVGAAIAGTGATVAAGVGLAVSGTFLGLQIADQAIRHDPNVPQRLNEKGEWVPLGGMNIGIIVDMIFDLAVRDGTIVIQGEDNGVQAKPDALHLSREQFDEAKKVAGQVVNWTLVVIPILFGGVAMLKEFFKEGVKAAFKGLAEKIGAGLSEAASSIRELPGNVAGFFMNKPMETIASGIREGLGTLRSSTNIESAAQVVSKVATISQGAVGIQQGVMAKELAELQAILAGHNRDMKGVQGGMELLSSAMPLLASVFKEMLDTQLVLYKDALSIIRQMNTSSINASRNASAIA
jgi:hypothetical protein